MSHAGAVQGPTSTKSLSRSSSSSSNRSSTESEFDSDASQDWSLEFDKTVFERIDEMRRKIITGSSDHRVRDFIRAKKESVTERAKEVKSKVTERAKEVKSKITKKASQIKVDVKNKATGIRRKVITGSADKRVRDYMNETPVVKRTDKISFTLGVLIANAAQYMLAAEPQDFGYFFAIVMTPMLFLRYYLYKIEKWHYFLLDFCYAVQVMCIVDIMYPTRTLRQILYIYANGPIAFAIPIWRNCIVFHSLDKMVSTFVHFFPALLMFTHRYYPREEEREIMCGPDPDTCVLDMSNYLFYSVAGYLTWQVLYLIKTEIFDAKYLYEDDAMWTSMKWHCKKKGTPTARVFLKLLRKLGIFAKDEVFNSHEAKTKITYVMLQLVFTILTMAPTIVMFNSKVVHLTWLGGLYVLALWNGAAYYIEVFASTYMRKFQDSMDAMDKSIKKDLERMTQEQNDDSNVERLEKTHSKAKGQKAL